MVSHITPLAQIVIEIYQYTPVFAYILSISSWILHFMQKTAIKFDLEKKKHRGSRYEKMELEITER